MLATSREVLRWRARALLGQQTEDWTLRERIWATSLLLKAGGQMLGAVPSDETLAVAEAAHELAMRTHQCTDQIDAQLASGSLVTGPGVGENDSMAKTGLLAGFSAPRRMPIPVTSDPLALAHAENGRPDQGQQYAESALKLSQSPSADQRREATSLNTLGLLLQAQATLTGARPYYERALASWQKRGDHYREGMAFFQLGRLAVELGRVAEGIRLVALCCLIDQELGHPDTEKAWRTLTQLAAHLGWSQADLDTTLQKVAAAYRADRGRGLLAAAFADIPAG